jgi:Ras-related GTP-binding protein A/B
MDTYLSTQRSTIFQQVGVMIYVFDVESGDMTKDLEYFRDCLDGLRHYSPEAAIFLLIHKMDLVRDRQQVFENKRQELDVITEGTKVSVFGTSIYDESLYKVGYFTLLPLEIFTNVSRRGQIS